MSLELQLKSLRTIIRKNSIRIISNIIQNHVIRGPQNLIKEKTELCVFCGNTKEITKEHVIPRWVFEGCDKKFFTTTINGLNQSYNKTTIPVCSICNNERLNSLEVYINKLFLKIELNTSHFDIYEMENIIRWLEILDYKFQILNIRRIFIALKGNEYIPYLADFPLSMLRSNVNSPSKVVGEIRRSLKRVSVKNKDQNLNSLIVFKTSNKEFHFFHTMDDFIFLELPKYELAIFYFYKKSFSTIKMAHKEAMGIIKEAY